MNPANPSYQIVGVYDPLYLEQIAHSLEINGSKAGWIVHGEIEAQNSKGMDELTAWDQLGQTVRKDSNWRNKDLFT